MDYSVDPRETPHRTTYLRLRAAITDHILSGEEPKLSLSPKPLHASEWRPNLAPYVDGVPVETYVGNSPGRDNVREADLVQEGPEEWYDPDLVGQQDEEEDEEEE